MSSVELNPGIAGLDPDGLCASIYRQLYQNFFHAQDQGCVVEGDTVSVRLHNTAFGFAEAIAEGIAQEGTGGGLLLEYLKKSGDTMQGLLRANEGFEAGVGNRSVLAAYRREDEYGVEVTGALRVGGKSLFVGGGQVLSYDGKAGSVGITGDCLELNCSKITTLGEWLIGKNQSTGVYISSSLVSVWGNEVFHGGNANRGTVDWVMRDALVKGVLDVEGKALLKGMLRALSGAELGFDGKVMLSFQGDGIRVNNWLSLGSGYGLKLKDAPVLSVVGSDSIELGAVGGDLLLGNEATKKIVLASGVMDVNGSYMLLSKYGGGYFPDSLRVRHNLGEDLFSSYRESGADEGMIVHKRLRFGDSKGSYLYGEPEGISLHSLLVHVDPVSHARSELPYEAWFYFDDSGSLYKPLNRLSHSFYLSTDADFVCFDKPVEVSGSVGVAGSLTRLSDGGLFFSDRNFLLSSGDGVKHYGNAYFLDGLSSERFSSGFAGSGWAIFRNETTGSVSATFDELTIRKKMRVYEWEVQQISVTNGALWVSDHCQGDVVEKL